MVITSPFSSIKGYIVSKPPLVLFTLCLMGFAITTFTFAYYVEHNENIPNLDAHRDFVSLLKHLSKRSLCISMSDTLVAKIDASAVHNVSDEDHTTVYVSATIESSSVHNITHVKGYVPVLDWVGECTTAPVEKVKIVFATPQITNQSGANAENQVCVAITGPISVLQSAIGNKLCDVPPINSQASLGHIIYKSPNDIPTSCSEKSLKLTYIPNEYNSVLLTQHDRSVINLHLFHTSYFLLVMAITLICYAMIKGKPVTKHQSLEKVPLEV